MNVEMVVMRVLHIGFGVFWAGSALFIALILEPRLRELGPDYQRPVMGAVARVMGPMLGISAIVTILAGTTMALRISGGNLGLFVSSSWGGAILLGFIVSIAAFISGVATGMIANRVEAMGRSIQGRPPTPEEIGQLQSFGSRLTMLGRTTAVLVIVAVISMASARFL